jgi:hypothetical protein
MESNSMRKETRQSYRKETKLSKRICNYMKTVIWVQSFGELFFLIFGNADGRSMYMSNKDIFCISWYKGCKSKVIYPCCVLFKC